MAQAKWTVEHSLDYLERWFTEKFRLPACSPVFTEQPAAYWQSQMLCDLLHRRAAARAEFAEMQVAGNNSAMARAMQQQVCKQIDSISRVFGDPLFTSDAVTEAWDRAQQDGTLPDFSKHTEALKRSRIRGQR